MTSSTNNQPLSTSRVSELSYLIEAILFASTESLSVKQIRALLQSTDQQVSTKSIKEAIELLTEHYQARGVNLVSVAGGFRFQTNPVFKVQVAATNTEKASKVSAAMMETLATIAYRQPITRSEIEEIRGVAVSSYIIKTLTERHWVKVSGHKEVPGRPALYVTTKTFLEYFGLQSISQLPQIMPVNQSTNNVDVVDELETEA
ncbi:MAG: SMC-Scp complex subunit ScpB [Thalassotalea sp.]|nr:SMC-Scp complex subunit ScpB [Thalassotalea sp.]